VDTFVTLHQRHLVAVRVDPVQGHFNPTYKIEVFLEDGGQACRHEDDVTLLRKPADVGKNTPPDCVPQLVVVDTSAGVERCCRVDQEVVIYLTWGFVGGKECFDFFENGILAHAEKAVEENNHAAGARWINCSIATSRSGISWMQRSGVR
jgi:hypothetical protein